MVSIVAKVIPCIMGVVMFALVAASTTEAVSTDVQPSLDNRAGEDTLPSMNSVVNQAGPYADCCYNAPGRRGRGLGYWIIEGIWFVVRWFALLVWGFWPYVLTVIGGIILLFIGIPMVRKWRARASTGPPRDGDWTRTGDCSARQMDFVLPGAADENHIRPPAQSARANERVELPIRHQRDDMERERELHLQEFRRQQAERQQDFERRREQLRTEQEAPVPDDAEDPGVNAMEPPSGDDDGPVPAEPAEPAAPIPNTTTRRKARRNLLALLIAAFLTLAIVAGIGLLVAYVALASSSGTPAPAVVEPTRDLEATIVAAVALAMQPPPAAPTAVAQQESSNATPIATTPADAQPSPVPPEANPLPSDRLPTVECPNCSVPDQPADGYVDWIREPKVSEAGILTFRARIDERAGLVVAGPRCGFPNATLTDDDTFYGAIIPHSMADACGSLPGDWITEHYTHVNNLLTVRLQIDPLAASHPGLKLCLWTGGMTEELLDCVPVQQP